MSFRENANEWIKENIPTLSKVYDNKYVNMVYDRYASLPHNQQKTLAGVFVGSGVLLIVGYLFFSYIALWSQSSQARQSSEMISMIRDHQKHAGKKGGEINLLERSNRLAAAGAFKAHIVSQGRLANISPRMLQVEEKDGPQGTDGKGGGQLKAKQATVKLSRVNLTQLKGFLQNIEFGTYNLSISSLKVSNDDQLRGYMNVEMGIVAYIFQNNNG